MPKYSRDVNCTAANGTRLARCSASETLGYTSLLPTGNASAVVIYNLNSKSCGACAYSMRLDLSGEQRVLRGARVSVKADDDTTPPPTRGPLDHAAAYPQQGNGNTIEVAFDEPITEVPVAMNEGGCGIEFIEHEIYGGLYSQLVVGESFEEPHNSSTGLSVPWAIGGVQSQFGKTHRLLGLPDRCKPPAKSCTAHPTRCCTPTGDFAADGGGDTVAPTQKALNGLQYLQMEMPPGGTSAPG